VDDSTFQQTLPIDDNWWKLFEDPLLDSLIQVAIDQNYTLEMAAYRVEVAQTNLSMAKSAFYPTLGINVGWNKEQSSGNSTSLPQSREHFISGSLVSSWEIDVFGGIRNRVKTQKELYSASKETYNAAMVSLCAQLASGYMSLRQLQHEKIVVLRNLASQAEVVQMTEVRYKTGLVSKLDVAQAKSVYFSTKAAIPQIESGIIQYINALGVLMGLYPQDVADWLDPVRPLPQYIELIGVGIPANLLRRRPDVRAAERQVAANAATVGATKSDWWPTFYLKGSVGFAAQKTNQLFNQNSLTYEIAPTMNWNLFQGTKRINATRQAKALLNVSVSQFNQTILNAVQEVDNAMNRYRNSVKQQLFMKEVVNQGKETFTLSLELYKQGLAPFQNVLDAQRSLLTYEDSLVQAQGSSLLALIQLYQSLGGGWMVESI
jgi:NodT family efflux transporter outer membrane factor (OMF) lipoprotein